MIRVFMVSPGAGSSRVPPMFGGGIEAYIYNLSRKLVSLGQEVHIICRWFPNMPLEEKLDGIYVHRIKVNEQSERLSLIMYSLQVAKKLTGLLCDKYVIIHCHERTSGMGIFLLRIHKRAPIIFSEHNADSLVASRQCFDNWLLYRMNLWAESYMIKHCDKIFAISEAMKRTIIHKVKVPPEKVVTTPNSIDTDKLRPGTPDMSVKKRLGISDDPLVLFAGRLVPQKGIDYLIRAMPLVQREVPSAKLVICGESKRENDAYHFHLRDLAHNLGKSVIFTGRTTFQDLIEIYKACSVFVLPSLFEVMPTVVLEAMALAKPVVATNISGTNEVVRNGETGFLVEPRNIKMLAEALTTLLKDEQLAKKMGEKGRRVVETSFSWDKAARKILEEYHEVLSH